MLGQPPGGHILLTNRRDADWRRLAVRPRAWSSVLPATAQAMTADPSSSTSTWSASLVAAASPVALSANEDPGPRTWSSSACRSCSVTPWCASSSTTAPRSRNNVGFIGGWRLRVTRASIRIGSRGIRGWLRGPDDAVASIIGFAAVLLAVPYRAHSAFWLGT